MFKNTNIALFLVLMTIFATFAAATPTMLARTGGGGGGSSCGSTDVQCCQHVGTFSEVENFLDAGTKLALISAFLGLLGLTVDAVLGVVLGVTCSGISVGGSW